MQCDFSKTNEGMPRSAKQAATASPEGPAPTMMGQWTHVHLRLGSPSRGGPILSELQYCVKF